MQEPRIENEKDYGSALQILGNLMRLHASESRANSLPGGVLESRLEAFAASIEAYEKQNHAIGLPDPSEAIQLRLRQLGLSEDDLARRLRLERRKLKELLLFREPMPHPVLAQLHQILGLSFAVLRQVPRAQLRTRGG